MTPPVPLSLLREAFDRSGEKHYRLSRALYSFVFGAAWREALLGFSYLKLLDDAVDEDPDAARARARIAAQRRLMDDVYAGRADADGHTGLERYGREFFSRDRERGARVRPMVEAVIETLEFDVERRGRVLPGAELDANAVKGGGNLIRYLAHFIREDLPMPPALIERASLAYVHADSLIDLEHDLAFGVINVPAEAVERHGIDLSRRDGALTRWLHERSADVETLFEDALHEGGEVEDRSLKLLGALYLRRKRRAFRRWRSALAAV